MQRVFPTPNDSLIVICFSLRKVMAVVIYRLNMTLQGHPRSSILAPIESAYRTSYWSSIVTLVLSCRISAILQLLYSESHFFVAYLTPIPAKISDVPLESIHDLRVCGERIPDTLTHSCKLHAFVAQSSVAQKIIRPNVFRPTGFSPNRLTSDDLP